MLHKSLSSAAPAQRSAAASARTSELNSEAERPPLQEVAAQDSPGVAALSSPARRVPARAAKPRRQRQRLTQETRAQVLERLINPIISLHEASILLEVCPATVRRYSDSGLLPHVRTPGRQRRYRFRDVLALIHKIDAKRKKH